MKILFNAANLRKGGSLHTAVSILSEILSDGRRIDWRFAVSDSIANELDRLGIDVDSRFTLFRTSPAKDKAMRRRMLETETETGADLVFTFLGPAYVPFRGFHLLGCAQGWVTHSTWRAYHSLIFPQQWISIKLYTMYQAHWYGRADAWVVQTETARQGFHRRFRVPLERIAVIPNNCAGIYHDRSLVDSFPGRGQRLRILTFSAVYPHKRLDLLPAVARHLKALRPNLDFQFVLTLPADCKLMRLIQLRAAKLNVTDKIVNEGSIHTADGPALYQSCHISFLPTVLESFSATYPESMAMGLPVVTTDLPFARDVCHDGALYFRPDDPRDAAAKIAKLSDSKELWDRLTSRAHEVVEQLPRPSELLGQYVQLIERLCRARSAKQVAGNSSE